MKTVYLNGQYLVPDGAIDGRGTQGSASSMDFNFKRGRLFFDFTVKCGDVIAVVKTFMGITWSNRYYRVSSYKKIPPNTPLHLGPGGEVVAEGLMATVQEPPRQSDYSAA
jgi:hypothetical protein